MNKIFFSYIRRWLLFYLLMVLLTTAAIYLLIYLHLTGTWPLGTTREGLKSRAGLQTSPPSSVSGLELGLILILTGGLVTSAGIGFAWYRITTMKFERPVRVIRRAVNQLARGQLNETVAIDTPDEFGQIGSGINELAANLQELLLYIWKQTGQCSTWLEHIHNNPDLHHDRRLTLESLGYLKLLSESIEDLREMAKSYVFYDVSLDGNKTRAINVLGEKSSTDRQI
jgi:methyl-accepting chemotaxis protein